MNETENLKDDNHLVDDFVNSLSEDDIWNSVSESEQEVEPAVKQKLEDEIIPESVEPVPVSDEHVVEVDDFARSLSEGSSPVHNAPVSAGDDQDDYGEFPLDITDQYNNEPEITPPAYQQVDAYRTKSQSPQYQQRDINKERRSGVYSNYPVPREFRDTENYITFSEISFAEISRASKQIIPINSTNFIRLRGVDYSAYPDDIVEFLRPFLVRHIFMGIDKGRPSGQVVVQLFNTREAVDAYHECNRKQLMNRYIEIFPHPEIPRPFWSEMHVLTHYRFSPHLKELLKNKPRYDTYPYPEVPPPHQPQPQYPPQQNYYNMHQQYMPQYPVYSQPQQPPMPMMHPVDPYASSQYNTPIAAPVKAIDPRKKAADREKQMRCSIEVSQVPSQMPDQIITSFIDAQRIPWATETFSRKGTLCWFTVIRPEDVPVIIEAINTNLQFNGFPLRAKKWVPK